MIMYEVWDAVSPRVMKELKMGKYTRWAQHVTVDSLQALLLAVGVFSKYANQTRCASGMHPIPVFEGHFMDERRMRQALEDFSDLYAGTDSEHEPQAGTSHFTDPQGAFTNAFKERLGEEPFLEWALGLNERQLWRLLWQVGEYGGRVNSSARSTGEFPPPKFNLPPEVEKPMREALRIIARIKGGELITLGTARNQILG